MPFFVCVCACVRVRVRACFSAEACAQADTSGHLNDLNVSLQVGSEYGFNDHLMWADQFAGTLLRAFSLRECTEENIFITLCILNCSKTISRWDRPLQKIFWQVGEIVWRKWHYVKALKHYRATSFIIGYFRCQRSKIKYELYKLYCPEGNLSWAVSARHKCTKTTYKQRAHKKKKKKNHTWQSSWITSVSKGKSNNNKTGFKPTGFKLKWL